MRDFSLTRLQSDGVGTHSRISDGSTAICEALELAFHAPKIAGRTRIPSGTYKLGFRARSHFDAVYRERVTRAGQIYRGMIEIENVPDFSALLFHCGNTIADSEACVLCGNRVVAGASGYFIPGGESEPAFLRLYAALSAAIAAGGAQLCVNDLDRTENGHGHL
jgi:hypothetical protein